MRARPRIKYKPGVPIPDRGKRKKKQSPRHMAYAHRRVELAIQYGQLERPTICPRCGDEPDSPIQAHHKDYSKPLEVTWLCAKCHVNLHIARGDRPPWPGEQTETQPAAQP